MAQDNSEQLDLEYTRAKRRDLVEKLTKTGMPGDIKEQSILLQTLDGIDRAALGKMKIKSDEGLSNAQAAAASILSSIFNDPRTKSIGKGAGVIPVLDADIAPTKLVEGELDSNPITGNFEDFMSDKK